MTDLPRFTHFIDGACVPASDGGVFPTEDPFTGAAWAEIARGTAADVDAAVVSSRRAFVEGEWPKLTASRRGALMRKVADLIAADAERLAGIERRDNGKLAAEVVAQVRYMADYFHYYAGLADKIVEKI